MSSDQSSDRPLPESAQDIHVRLKPLMGIEPKFYLAGLYLVILLAVLFGFLVWPGLSQPGTRVTVTTTPPGAAVFYAGKHYGTTPVTAFFPEGQGVLEVTKPGFRTVTRDYTSGNNLVASLVFPRTDALDVTLEVTSDQGLEHYYRSEVGRWALALPFTSDYRFPPLFTRLAADARAAGWDQERLRTLLLGLRPAVADSWMYADYGRALGLWTDTVPTDLEAQYELWKPLVAADDRLALWVLANQTKPQKDRETTEPSNWFEARTKGFQGSLAGALTTTFGPAPAAHRTALGSFRGVGAATFLWGSEGTSFSLPVEPPFALPVPVTTAAFWMADAEVTQAQYAAFVAAVPRWAPAGKQALVDQGLVDDDYLTGWEGPQAPAPTRPVASVSWYAAQAYVDWLNATGQGVGKKAVLPDDLQWEAAARSGAPMVNQGVWEWTASAYFPGDSLVGVPATGEAYAHSIKGGVADAKPTVAAGQRAGWPSHRTTSSLGFRIALIGAP